MTQEIESVYKGSGETAAKVRSQILARWGTEAAARYNPKENCFALNRWNQMGMRVKKGEKGIKSVTFFKYWKTVNGRKVEEFLPRTITLFFDLQVEPKRPYQFHDKDIITLD